MLLIWGSNMDGKEVMREEYNLRENKVMFKTRLKYAFESGLLLFAKYGLIVLLIYISLQFVNGLIAGATNGNNSAIYLNQLIEKGYLPRAINGQIPPKEETDEKTSSIK